MVTAARSPPLQMSRKPLITRQAGIDIFRPRLDASGDVAGVGVAVGPKPFGDPHAAGAVVAEDEDPLIAGDLGEASWNIPHRNLQAAGDLANRQLVRFAYVQQHISRLLRQSGGFGDVDLNGNIHGSGGVTCAVTASVQVQFAVDAT